MKKSFIIHIDSLSILDKLSNEQKGILFEAIRQHHLGNEIDLDFAMSLAFEPFKNQFDRDLITYENRCKINKANGSKGGKQKVANGSKRKQTQANLADSDNDSDSVNDKDKDKEDYTTTYLYGGHLSISLEDFNKLAKEYGTENATEYCHNVLNWNKNSKVKSLYLTALKWLKRDNVNAKQEVKSELQKLKEHQEKIKKENGWT